jgi:hypothetical protein
MKAAVVSAVSLQDFHRVARACSAAEDTVHYMHSMNWVKDVMGASHMDLLMMVQEDKHKEVVHSLHVCLAQLTSMGPSLNPTHGRTLATPPPCVALSCVFCTHS